MIPGRGTGKRALDDLHGLQRGGDPLFDGKGDQRLPLPRIGFGDMDDKAADVFCADQSGGQSIDLWAIEFGACNHGQIFRRQRHP